MKAKRPEAYFVPTEYNSTWLYSSQDANNGKRLKRNEKEKQKLAAKHPRKLRRK